MGREERGSLASIRWTAYFVKISKLPFHVHLSAITTHPKFLAGMPLNIKFRGQR
jgi:hypothetical protein